MYQLIVTVNSLDQLLELGAHLQALSFLDESSTSLSPPQPESKPAPQPKPQQRESKPAPRAQSNGQSNEDKPPTENQWSYMMDLAEKNGWDPDTFEIALMERFDIGDIDTMTRAMCSNAIDALLAGDFRARMQG